MSRITIPRLLLLAGSFIGLLGFILPFFRVNFWLIKLKIGGMTWLKGLTNLLELTNSRSVRAFFESLWSMVADAPSAYDFGRGLALWFIALGPIFLLFIHLRHLVKFLFRGRYKRGLAFTVIYSFLAWFFLWYGSEGTLVSINFFKQAGVGYWLMAGGVVLAASSYWWTRLTRRSV